MTGRNAEDPAGGLIRPGGRIRVEVDVHVPPGTELVEMLRWVGSLSQVDPDRHEIEAFLYMTLARSAWRRADELRQAARRRRAAAARRAAKGSGVPAGGVGGPPAGA